MNIEFESTRLRGLPETINIHLTRHCNFRCHFCYAQFQECGGSSIPEHDLRRILRAISCSTPFQSGRKRKVNFAGGEPLLYPGFMELINFCKELGFVTSLVTNGSLLKENTIGELAGLLNICAISIDSGFAGTNKLIGRSGNRSCPDAQFYLRLGEQIKTAGIRFKVNTVVSRFNLSENLTGLISELQPFRWKLFQVKKVIGQNDKTFERLAISGEEFMNFVMLNIQDLAPGMVVVPETDEQMTGSYAMIAPNGCFLDSAFGVHRYSRPILDIGVLQAFEEVAFDAVKFQERGGLYD